MKGRLWSMAAPPLAAVRVAMLDMPADQRILLMLVCVDGLSYREASETLGILPLGTVMSRLSRAGKVCISA